MQDPKIQKNPFIVPTNDKKLIEEHFGQTSIGGDKISIAHMIAPPNWSEPFQNPDFDEYTLMVRGNLKIEVNNKQFEITKGESILVYKGSRVQYFNPFKESAEYWSICSPAFSIKLANRE